MRPPALHRDQESGIQVLDRAMHLLALLAEAPKGASVTSLAAEARLSRSTARRVLAALEHHGLTERVDDRYQLGMRLFELGSLVQARLDLRERSRPELERLAGRTNLTAFLCIRDGGRAICIDRIDGQYAHTLALRLGGSLPLHAGASPLVLLAHAPDDDVDAYLQSPAARESFTERTYDGADAVRRAVRAVRAQGYAVSDEDVTVGVAAVGAPVLDHSGAVAAAVSVSGLIPHVLGERRAEIVALVQETGRAISERLGYHPRADARHTRPASTAG